MACGRICYLDFLNRHRKSPVEDIPRRRASPARVGPVHQITWVAFGCSDLVKYQLGMLWKEALSNKFIPRLLKGILPLAQASTHRPREPNSPPWQAIRERGCARICRPATGLRFPNTTCGPLVRALAGNIRLGCELPMAERHHSMSPQSIRKELSMVKLPNTSSQPFDSVQL